eukprot:12938436-Prorocentrum_lima.AAC.1
MALDGNADEGPNSPRHPLTHLPKHPDCDVCQKAKAQRRPGRRVNGGPGTDHPEPELFGDSFTMDHWVPTDDLVQGYNGE